ncbi:membrane protein [Actibacterium mucosum KCTC 23349]|uniref:Membrane protein n=1 Tax=Actibacterium mucosum KCTC 23349 TaxID=1454373 RepID=A0A037ZGF2_9RHOB|nr:DUF2157 domain-containing protein [Actibacterium mucosum]KAJ54698.1 membrane protein [Actibacterium mucosum KCTC 23349]
MHVVADTDQLIADGVITQPQADEIRARARDTMVTLAVNTLLCAGIIAATAGFIFWLADALSVAVLGGLMLAGGITILTRGSDNFAMFGNASALIGAGMLIGGAAAELLNKYDDIAGQVMALGGAVVAGVFAWALRSPKFPAKFVAGSALLMGLALHLGGVAIEMMDHQVTGLPKALLLFYAAALVAVAGWLTDVRLVTALAIVPFAQMLDTGTFYFHAAYVFYSPEPTLSILQMSALIALCLWTARRWPPRHGRHALIAMMLAFVVANLCALVGSLWGDVVGQTMWGPGRWSRSEYDDWEDYQAARDAFEAQALVISEHVFSVLWAVVLIALAIWAAHSNRRGLFNAAITFGAIHVYTQFYESFFDEPLAYVIGGLAAIPLAWGMWRLNKWFVATRDTA